MLRYVQGENADDVHIYSNWTVVGPVIANYTPEEGEPQEILEWVIEKGG